MQPLKLVEGVAEYLWTTDGAEDHLVDWARRSQCLEVEVGLAGSCPSRRWERPGHRRYNTTEEVHHQAVTAQSVNHRLVAVVPMDSAPPGLAKAHNDLEYLQHAVVLEMGPSVSLDP
jgi:hypothetical protein